MVPRVKVTHWLPIVTFCPVNNLPDLIYVEVEFEDNELHELYALRKQLRALVQWKRMFMEDVCAMVAAEFATAVTVRVILVTGRHVVTIRRAPQ